MGRNSTGVKAITLKGDDQVISMAVVEPEAYLLTLSEKGYGKRSHISDFRLQHRGGSGIIAMNITEKTGKLATAIEVGDTEDVMIITEKGIVIRQRVDQVSVIGRNTQGVRMIRLDENDLVSAIAPVVQSETDETEEPETEE
jgi:DNA gyrase subunit A